MVDLSWVTTLSSGTICLKLGKLVFLTSPHVCCNIWTYENFQKRQINRSPSGITLMNDHRDGSRWNSNIFVKDWSKLNLIEDPHATFLLSNMILCITKLNSEKYPSKSKIAHIFLLVLKKTQKKHCHNISQ